MTGVEILTSNEVVVETAFNWMAFFISTGILLILFVVFGVFMSVIYKEWDHVIIGIIIGVAFGVIFGPILGSVTGKPVRYETQYKIIISEDVSMTEFYERYEMIEQDGKIFTVREKSE